MNNNNKYLIGSRYFFKDMPNFNSKDTDTLVLVEKPKDFKNFKQTTGKETCVFEWRKMSASEFVKISLHTNPPMIVGKFLIPEFCKDIGFTIEHLKQLEEVFDRLDDKHRYEKIIYDSYIYNNDFILTDEQRKLAYESYLEDR